MASSNVLMAHILRRTGFVAHPDRVDALAAGTTATALDRVIDAAPMPLGRPPSLSDRQYEAPTKWWLRRMRDPRSGLHERMTWFWHGHLTTSREKVGSWKMMWKQHLLIRRYALGAYRTFLQKMTIDPAMLIYLDGNYSSKDGPNENYARELQELFTIGRENVREPNVRAGALALTGWHVDWERAVTRYSEWGGYDGTVTFLGRTVKGVNQTVAAAVEHRACAPFLATKLYRQFVGADPSDAQVSRLADLFRKSDTNVKPLVAAILRDPAFLEARATRAREPVEWISAAMVALGLKEDDFAIEACWRMGQMPFYPPSVAGWPTGMRWLAPSLALARAALAVETPELDQVGRSPDAVSTALRRCSLFEVSDKTRAAMEDAARSLKERRERAIVVMALAIASPEFAIA